MTRIAKTIAAVLLTVLAYLPASNAVAQTAVETANKATVQAAFDRWKRGEGGPFELLTPDAQWTITGTSLAAGTYKTKQEFLDKVIVPFNARITRPLSPTIREIHSAGDTVVALFDADTVANDGKPYVNTYAWFMQMKDGRIIKATAFYDSKTFDDFWTRVKPKQ